MVSYGQLGLVMVNYSQLGLGLGFVRWAIMEVRRFIFHFPLLEIGQY